MGTTFVEINEKGFWVRDSLLELWLRLTSLHLDEPQQHDSLIHEIRNQWLLASRGYFGGCIPVCLGVLTSTEGGKNIVVKAIRSLLENLKHAPETLDMGVLNLLGVANTFTQHVESWRLIEISEAVLDVIEGKIESTAEQTDFMPGCQEAPYAVSQKKRQYSPKGGPFCESS